MAQPTDLTPETHRRALVDHVGANGRVEDLSDVHLSIFRPGEGTLLVTFESLAAIRARRGGRPWSASLAQTRNVATLTIAGMGKTWFRDQALFDYFDEMTDDGVFDEYDTVIFAGGGMGGYGAAAFSVAAPGSVVFLAQPYATLDRDIAPWETRFGSARSLAFGPRYGNAADMIDAAARVYVVTDPYQQLDAMHASLFRGAHVTRLPAPHGGPDLWLQLQSMHVLDQLVTSAGDGTLTPLRFARIWRARRSDPVWLGHVLRKLEGLNRPLLTATWAAAMLNREDSPSVRRRLKAALVQLAEDGHEVPRGLQPKAVGRSDRMQMAGE
ncbi:MAG: phosphoadenosine phosphosulfate reductase [Pseudomonadota bacterium]